ncbi:tetrahydroberberine oxidase-like [Coffea arabica]|uniref:Tetrahydroberberine oxidase-like n=1 Tax=Coffea arabica TaxID=13443 RepID=A0A6P6VSI8_COFAR|nr:berberine bridge enzyme-like 24 [Coffea arabica]
MELWTMQASSYSSLPSLLSLLILLLVTIQAGSVQLHDGFVQCLASQNSSSISDIIYTPENSSYLSILQSSAQNLRSTSISSSEPAFILTPCVESQIQAAIYCAKKLGIQIRVRSGGHDYEGLSYISRIPFVLVDLRNLSSISVDTENYAAWVQAGATLGELYHRVAEKSRRLAVVGGTCHTVGVGGHFSGGGYSMMSRKFGMAVDHIIDAKIIDVNGQILDRKSMGEDLFWAIRGGGGASFGIIVAWKISLVSVPENVTIFNVTKTMDQNAIELVHKWQYIADKIDPNLAIRLEFNAVSSPQDGNRTIRASFVALFLGGVDDLLYLMQQSFREMGLVKEDCSEMSWIESTLFFALFPRDESIDVLLSRTPVYRLYFKGKSDFVRHPISVNGLKGMLERILEDDSTNAHRSLQFSPYGGRLSEILESATSFPHRGGNVYIIHYWAAWSREHNNAENTREMKWIRRLYKHMAPYVSKSPRAAYLNYRDLDLGVNNIDGITSYEKASIWGTKYFKQNFDRLMEVKTMVDPGDFFKNEQSIPPLSGGTKEISNYASSNPWQSKGKKEIKSW